MFDSIDLHFLRREQPPGAGMRIFLVDDHELFRSGLRLLLSGLQEDIEFVEANNAEDVVNYPDKPDIDLVLLDLYLPGIEGFEGLDRIKQYYSCPVVVLSSEDDARVIRSSISQGAAGFIPKSSSPEILMAAMQLVLADGIYLPPHVLEVYADRLDDESADDRRDAVVDQLTERQLKVLIMAAQGKPNKVIARELSIAEGTVKAHLSACYQVLEVKNRTEAVYATAAMGLLP